MLELKHLPRWSGLSLAVVGLMTLTLLGASLPVFSAGAHIDVHVPSGQVRQYSLCSDPEDTSFWRIGVLREPASRGQHPRHLQLRGAGPHPVGRTDFAGGVAGEGVAAGHRRSSLLLLAARDRRHRLRAVAATHGLTMRGMAQCGWCVEACAEDSV